MNEQKLIETWENFATNQGFKFDKVHKPNFQGVIINLNIQLDSNTILKAQIGKTTTGINQKWTKFILCNQKTELKNQTFKNSIFSFFYSKNSIKASFSKFLKDIGASELIISENTITLKFNDILYLEEQLKAILIMPGKIKQQLTHK